MNALNYVHIGYKLSRIFVDLFTTKRFPENNWQFAFLFFSSSI